MLPIVPLYTILANPKRLLELLPFVFSYVEPSTTSMGGSKEDKMYADLTSSLWKVDRLFPREPRAQEKTKHFKMVCVFLKGEVYKLQSNTKNKCSL